MPIFAHKNCRASFSWKIHLFSVFYFFVVLLDSIFEKPRGLVPQNTFWIFENCDKLNFILRTLKRSLAWLKCSYYVNLSALTPFRHFQVNFSAFPTPHPTLLRSTGIGTNRARFWMPTSERPRSNTSPLANGEAPGQLRISRPSQPFQMNLQVRVGLLQAAINARSA